MISEPITPAALAELKRLSAAATPRPWTAADSPLPRTDARYWDVYNNYGHSVLDELTEADALSIAAFRNHADSLIAAAEERDALTLYRAESELVIENISKALFPDSPHDSRIAEFMLDGMGACQVIERIRRERNSQAAEIVRLKLRLDCLTIPTATADLLTRAEKAEAECAELRAQLVEAQATGSSDLHGCDPIREGSKEKPEWENNPI